jgi:GNAT superfamily N-acetyltransferase
MGRGSQGLHLLEEREGSASLQSLIDFHQPVWANPPADPALRGRPSYPLKEDEPAFDSPLKKRFREESEEEIKKFMERAAETQGRMEEILARGIPEGNLWNSEVLNAAMAFKQGEVLVIPTGADGESRGFEQSRHLQEKRVEADIFWQGRKLGRIKRAVIRNTRGQLAVFNYHFDVDHSIRGQGIGRNYATHFEKICRARGVREIAVHAGDAVGGYAWATPGWVLAGDEEHQRFQLTRLWLGFGGGDFGAKDRTRWAMEEGRYPKELWLEMDNYFYKIATGEMPVPTPYEISLIGKNHTWAEGNYRNWPGRTALLFSNWEGRRFLKKPPKGKEQYSIIHPALPHYTHRADLDKRIKEWGEERSS